MDKEELERLIGKPPQGSHPDEWLPRANTWHEERINWQKEVERLRGECAKLRQHLAKIDGAVQDALTATVQF